jgi:hypothetical protein
MHQSHQRHIRKCELDGEEFRDFTGVQGLDAQEIVSLNINLQVERYAKVIKNRAEFSARNANFMDGVEAVQ